MKRLSRNPEKFEALELFSELSHEHGLKIQSPEDVEKFIAMIGDSLKASKENQILLHGKRIELLFRRVAAGLGECSIIKNEDAGGVISDDEGITLPDYRIILKDGRQIFVEVKNHGHLSFKSQFLLNKDYVLKLQRYGEINNVPVYFAIYYRSIRQWALMPVNALIELKKKYSTNVMHSLANNEMAMLGDLMVGTKPPLIFEIVADTTHDQSIDTNHQIHFIIGDVKIYCDDKELTDLTEKNIAFYLMRFGRWDCDVPEAVMDGNNIHSIRYTFNAESPEDAEQNGFGVIGYLSSMITEAFNEQTVYKQQVTAIDANGEPDVFSVKISKNYNGKKLPLWLFEIHANPDFNGETDEPEMQKMTAGQRMTDDT